MPNNTLTSNKAIDRLGDRIRMDENSISQLDLNDLQEYRITHQDTLSKVFNILCKSSKKISNEAITTYRIKRIDSIIRKLNRYPKMQFSRMWDIGGCRCILNSNQEVYKLRDLLYKELEIKKEYDYIKEPQTEGYQSLHLFASIANDKKVIEIQIRNQKDHNWATLVEITDLLFDSKLKEYHENKELLRFHFLLSKIDSINLKEKNEIACIIKKYKYFEKLSAVFSKNYIQVRKQWFNIEFQINHKYILIEAKRDGTTKINSYYSFSEAEANYFNQYKSGQNSNIVLTYLPNPCYKQISIAYSNYILTYHSFLTECFTILENLITESLQHCNYLSFQKTYNLFNSLIFVQIKNLRSEMNAINEYWGGRKKKSNKNKKEKEWVGDINAQISRLKSRSQKIQLVFLKDMPKSKFERTIIRTIIYFSNIKYTKKIKSLK